MQTVENTLRVLLVEDCSLTIEQLQELLHSLSCAVTLSSAATEREAILAVVRELPDLIILDLNLKRGSGFRVLRTLREISSPPMIVVLTNFALPQYRDLALLMGANYFLDKALDMDALPAIVEGMAAGQDRIEALDKHRATRLRSFPHRWPSSDPTTHRK